ncbi:hypothetical protein EVAR_35899_1 [Eumeta japonica]|uniref:Uncharacterized protein n=1 Tax=Eumeta variegata TaxID=151549 RepID=A0A4C1WWZ9_EUMVA|nr:hypothetical protein EVAR_35899_1 [Eumeta japonica]
MHFIQNLRHNNFFKNRASSERRTEDERDEANGLAGLTGYDTDRLAGAVASRRATPGPPSHHVRDAAQRFIFSTRHNKSIFPPLITGCARAGARGREARASVVGRRRHRSAFIGIGMQFQGSAHPVPPTARPAQRPIEALGLFSSRPRSATFLFIRPY